MWDLEIRQTDRLRKQQIECPQIVIVMACYVKETVR